jgi:hypothetical protein
MTVPVEGLGSARTSTVRAPVARAATAAIVLLVGLVRLVAAQNIITLPGKSVEVLGLRNWTLEMLQDSMARYAPGESLGSHACAAVLRYKLGFPDAVAYYYSPTPVDSVERVVVALIEPGDSARVQFSDLPLGTGTRRPDWTVAYDLLERSRGVQYSALYRLADRQRGFGGSQSESVEAYAAFIVHHAEHVDRDTALTVLGADPDYVNRTVAASILLNFLDEDTVVWALTDALLETDGPVKTTAATTLQSLVTIPRTVDWRPAADALHKILDGTSLPVLMTVMEVLVATGVDPSLARPLLRGGGEGVLMFMSAHHPHFQSSAHRLLTALRGEDLGGDVDVWRTWVAAL